MASTSAVSISKSMPNSTARAPELLVTLFALLGGALAVVHEIEFDVDFLGEPVVHVVADDPAAHRVHERALFLLEHAALADE
jgi:hypothetical protein